MWHAWERREKCTKFWWESMKGKSLQRLGRGWVRGIRMDLREMGSGCVEWIQMAQDRDQWQALVNTVMNLWVLATHRVSWF
jgi:hypothetical protein